MGEAPFSFYGYQYEGVYMSQAEIDSDPVEYSFTVHPGDGRYVDVNGDGRIDSADRTNIGNPEPDFTWALTNGFQYKNLDFSFLIHGSVGGDLYFADTHRSLFWHEGRNYLAEKNNRWRSEEEPGDGYHYKLSVDTNGFEREPSSYWIVDASYARLKNVSIGYSLPARYTERLGMRGARIFINGTNLFTIKSASAIDPENVSGSTTDPANRGVQHQPYPSTKTFTAGLNIQF